MSPRHDRSRIVAGFVLGATLLALAGALSCARREAADVAKLPQNLYGFYLGDTKDETFKRARGIADIRRAPDPPMGYRGELYNFSATLDPHPEVEYVRCAFFDGRLMEIVVYFRDTSLRNLEWLKLVYEGQFETHAVAEDPAKEMAQKTYRLQLGEMSVTIRRITKKERIELYVQCLHEELVKRLRERNEAAEKK